MDKPLIYSQRPVLWVPLLLAWLLLSPMPRASACDGCGCSAVQPALPGWYAGSRTLIGLRYRFVPVQSYGLPSIQDGVRPFSQQYIHIAELWSRVQLGRRWAVSAFVPGILLQRTGADNDRSVGLGDITTMGQFTLYQTPQDTGISVMPHLWQHRLQVGLGLKLPTGRYQDPSTSAGNAALQPALGTGSWDGILSLSYAARHKRWAVSADVMGKYNTANRDDYRFGHRFMANLAAHYQLPNPKLPLQFTAGTFLEHAGIDHHEIYPRSETGGTALYASAGIDWIGRRFTAGLMAQQPIAQQWAKGYVQFGTRLQATVNLLF